MPFRPCINPKCPREFGHSGHCPCPVGACSLGFGHTGPHDCVKKCGATCPIRGRPGVFEICYLPRGHTGPCDLSRDRVVTAKRSCAKAAIAPKVGGLKIASTAHGLGLFCRRWFADVELPPITAEELGRRPVVVVREEPAGRGYGLQAAASFKAGDVVAAALVSPSATKYKDSDQYGFGIDLAKSLTAYPYLETEEAWITLDGTRVADVAALCNEADRRELANCELVPIFAKATHLREWILDFDVDVDVHDPEAVYAMGLRATRSICAGESVLTWYGSSYDRSKYASGVTVPTTTARKTGSAPGRRVGVKRKSATEADCGRAAPRRRVAPSVLILEHTCDDKTTFNRVVFADGKLPVLRAGLEPAREAALPKPVMLLRPDGRERFVNDRVFANASEFLEYVRARKGNRTLTWYRQDDPRLCGVPTKARAGTPVLSPEPPVTVREVPTTAPLPAVIAPTAAATPAGNVSYKATSGPVAKDSDAGVLSKSVVDLVRPKSTTLVAKRDAIAGLLGLPPDVSLPALVKAANGMKLGCGSGDLPAEIELIAAQLGV